MLVELAACLLQQFAKEVRNLGLNLSCLIHKSNLSEFSAMCKASRIQHNLQTVPSSFSHWVLLGTL